MASEPAFDAFISYRRSDGAAAARWLRRELQSFRPPKSLREKFPGRLKVYLDTAYERGTSDFYEQSIFPALMQSRYLLVLATPDAVHRPKGEDWIAREIGDFTRGPNARNVVAVRGAGEFNGPLPADLAQRFPNIEIVDIRGASRFSFLNPMKAARLNSEKLKLVAPLMDLSPEDMPRLRQEEERRQQGRFGTATGATLGVLAAVSGLSIYAFQSRNDAIRAMEDSMHAAGGMAQLASGLSVTDKDDQRTRGFIISQGCDLVDRFRQGVTSEPQASEYVMCRIERASQHEALSELDKARAQIADAAGFAARQHGKHQRMDAAVALLTARQAEGEQLLRFKDVPAAEKAFTALRDEAQTLAGTHNGRPALIRAEAIALERLGGLHDAAGDRKAAADNYDSAAAAVANYMKARADSAAGANAAGNIAWLARMHRNAGQQLAEIPDGPGAAERMRRSVSAVRDNNGEGPDLDMEVAVSQVMLWKLSAALGDEGAAVAARKDALAIVEKIVATPKLSRELTQRAISLRKAIVGETVPAKEAKSP